MTDAWYPVLFTVDISSEIGEVFSSNTILAFSEAKFTEALDTPGTFLSDRSIRDTQDEQCIPSMVNDKFFFILFSY